MDSQLIVRPFDASSPCVQEQHECPCTSHSSSRIDSFDSLAKRMPRHVLQALDEEGLTINAESNVTWAANSISHPRNWPLSRKLYDTAIICFLEFFMTLISITGSSVAPHAADELDISVGLSLFCFTTIYMIAQAFGSLIFPPFAERFGGRAIYVSTTFLFGIFCGILALWPASLSAVITCRLATGFVSAIPSVVAAGSIENMWSTAAQTFSIHVWILSALLGMSTGSMAATYARHSSLGWRLMFILAAATSLVATPLCYFMKESRPSKALRSKVKLVSKRAGFDGLSIEDSDSTPTLCGFLRSSLWLPLRLFFTEPIVALTSIMAAMVFGLIYMFSECLGIIYVENFGFSDKQASLVMLAVAVGASFSFLVRLWDNRIARLRLQQGTSLEPEDKLAGFYIAAPILAVGLYCFAWTVPPFSHSSSWVSISALVLVGFSVVEFDVPLSGFLCATYGQYASSASAPMSFLRANLSGVFPLFGQKLFRKLGPNGGLMLLSFIAMSFCGIAVVFYCYGKKIRERSSFAEKPASSSEEKPVIVEPSLEVPARCCLNSV